MASSDQPRGGNVDGRDNGLVAWFVANPMAAKFLYIAILVGGLVAGTQLVVQHLPEWDPRIVRVAISLPGAAPRQVEKDITRRVEEVVVGLPGVDRVVSRAVEGRGEIDVEMASFADSEAVFNDVATAVDALKAFLPANTETPEVKFWRWSLHALTLAVSSPSADENTLRNAAEEVRDRLLALPSVSHIEFTGAREREIAIELDEEQLRRYDLSARQVAKRVRETSTNITFGEFRTDSGTVILHTDARREFGAEYADIPLITRPDGTAVTLGDVAVIRDGFVEAGKFVRVDGVPAILVSVRASKEQSMLGIVDEIGALLEAYVPPSGVSVTAWDENATAVTGRLTRIVENGVIGIVLVFLALLLVLDLRAAFWITAGIVLSFVGSFVLFGLADLTINVVSVIAFFLMIGIVVDDAVVVGESIETARQRGLSGRSAAVAGARAVMGPIVVGTVTTLIALAPFFFVKQEEFQILAIFSFIALFVLTVSLIEAFLLLPGHLAHDRPWSLRPLSTIQGWCSQRLDRFRDFVVVTGVSWSIRHVWLSLSLTAAVMLAAFALLRADVVRLNLVLTSASMRADFVQADIRLPAGSPVDVTARVAERFAAAGEAINGSVAEGSLVRDVTIVVGEQAGTARGEHSAGGYGENIASVRLRLVSDTERTATPEDVEGAWIALVGDVPQVETVTYQRTRYKTVPNVAFALQHPDRETMHAAAREVARFLEGIPGVSGVSDGLGLGKRQFEVRLTPAGRVAGLTPARIGLQLRANLHGVEVQRIQRGREELRVMVRYPESQRDSLGDLARERIRIAPGREMALHEAATLIERRGTPRIVRIDGTPAVQIRAHADGLDALPRAVIRAVKTELLPELQERWPGVELSSDGGQRKIQSLLQLMAMLFPLAILAMYGLMAVLLKSYWRPLVAVLGIPMCLAGGIIMHLVLNWDFGLMSLFGIFAVSGVVMNDALVLLDRYSKLRSEDPDLPAVAAIAAATRSRFRAVFLTTLTTVLGLSPLLFARSDELVFMVPFVASMFGGLVFSSIFVLFGLPATIMMVEGRRE